jgi:hypothetical protein
LPRAASRRATPTSPGATVATSCANTSRNSPRRKSGSSSGRTSGRTPRTSCTNTSSTAGATPPSPAWCSLERLSSNWGIYGPAFELCENEPFPGKEEYNHNEKYEIKAWDWDKPGNIKRLVARFNRIRNANPCLRRTRNVIFAETDNPAIIAYVKKTPDLSNIIITVVNLDYSWTQSGWIELPLWQMGLADHESFTVRDLFSQDLPDEETECFT